MKHLFEYINRNYTDIYENFVVTDHVLTDEEINESFNRAINEGFWSWLGDLIKSMFTDSSKETKDFGESVFKYYDNNFDKKVADYNKKLFKEKNVDKFIDLVDEMYEELIDKKILSEVEAIQWAIGNLSIKGRILKDEGKTSDVEKINNKINKYSEKNEKAAQEFANEINKQPEEQKNDEVQAPSEQISKSVSGAFKQHENTIKELCTKCNTTPETLQKVVYEICNYAKETQNITDPNVSFGLILIAIGGYMTKGFQNRAKIVSTFMGTISMLLSEKKLKIKNQAL